MFFGVRGIILIAIAALLIFRLIGRLGGNRSNPFFGGRGAPGSQNAFCTQCGTPLTGAGLYCGGCGAKRP